MKAVKLFFFNASILTVTSLIIRIISVSFNVFLADRVGESGMGLYSLVMSVYTLAVTFACSGVGFASTRLTAEAVGRGSDRDIKASLSRCVVYSMFFSILAFLILFTAAPFVGRVLLGDVRTITSLRILAVALPFLSITSVFGGYFNAVRRVYKSATSMLLEQMVCVFVTTLIITAAAGADMERNCIYIAIGAVCGEVISFVCTLILFLFDLRRHNKSTGQETGGLMKRLLSISLPLSLGSYVRTGLISLEHMLIPKMLKRNGMTQDGALASYGLVHGMVLPVVLFPSAFLGAFAGLLVPELAEKKEKGDNESIDSSVSRAIGIALAFSICVAGIMICYAYEISVAVYSSSDSFLYIRALGALIPLMYTDTVIDSVLKGLNQQMFSMKVNIADAFLSVVMVCSLIPIFGINGYIAAIFIGEIINFSLSLTRMLDVCRPSIGISNILIPVSCIFLSVTLVAGFFNFFSLTVFSSTINVVLRIALTALVYFLFLIIAKYNYIAIKTALNKKFSRKIKK